MFFHCFSCKKVSPLFESAGTQCPLCSSANGEILSSERFSEGFKAGVYFNLDPKTGKPAKKKPK